MDIVTISACTSNNYQQIWQAERFADAETPLGAVNGTNLVFSLAHLPNPVSSVL